MIDFEYLNYCLDKARWCILNSDEPFISATGWLKIVLAALKKENNLEQIVYRNNSHVRYYARKGI